MTDKAPLAGRLAKIMGELGPIEKKGKITGYGSGPTYNFARDVDVLHAVIPKMAAEGIVMVPERVEQLPTTLTMSEKQFIANIRTDWLVTDGNEELRFQTFGQGADSGDKALPKAQSNARKYAFFMLYHIVTGDDPDHWASDEQPEQRRGAKASSPNAAAPVQNQYRRGELAQLMKLNHLTLDAVEVIADRLGITERPMSDESMDRLIAAIESERAAGVPPVPAPSTPQREGSPAPATTQATEDAAVPLGTSSGPAPAPSLDDVLAVSGGEEIPPKPGTKAYKDLPSGADRAVARAYWDKPLEQETMAAVLGAPEADR